METGFGGLGMIGKMQVLMVGGDGVGRWEPRDEAGITIHAA